MAYAEKTYGHLPRIMDAIIASLIVLPLLFAITAGTLLSSPWNWILATLFSSSSCVMIYAAFIEPKRITLNKKVIHISGLPSLKIAVIADFHVGPYKKEKFIRKIVQYVNSVNADVILLPGDFLFDHYSDIEDLSPLKDLRSRYGTYAIMGNHDTGHYSHFFSREHFRVQDNSDAITAFLRERGITVLRDASITITVDGTTFAIAGVDGQWADGMDLPKTFADVPSTTPIILMAHTPDCVNVPGIERASLIVSGHTHGGQVRLPFIGALYIPAETGKTYDHGIFHIGTSTILAVTHGIGETMMRMRFLCPPEVMEIEMNNEEIMK